MDKLKKTIFHSRHIELKAKMVDFGGWSMPIQYSTGIIKEHLLTRSKAGLFDVSHMGRFLFKGKDAIPFLRYVLTNDVSALTPGLSQYTIISNENGVAIDDAYIYRLFEDEYMLVVNAGNKQKDWDYLRNMAVRFKNLEIIDKSEELSMISIQGPNSENILKKVISSGELPEKKNYISISKIGGTEILVSKTGYTGEPIGFELILETVQAIKVWDLLIGKEAYPVGLGARDTLRLEANLPLYGHELGTTPEGQEMPIFSFPLSRFGVSFKDTERDFIGKPSLLKQYNALQQFKIKDYTLIDDLPQTIKPITLTGKGIGRAGYKVFSQEKPVGYITSGTSVPYYTFDEEQIAETKSVRSICLALLSSDIQVNDSVNVEIRGEKVGAVVVKAHLRTKSYPYAKPILGKKQ
ncbi:glycine cleavage system aminomethyltransferase GcvT [bacterium]|nr:glycine cleavage system aminomethyltransferase GcvT [bacterium]